MIVVVCEIETTSRQALDKLSSAVLHSGSQSQRVKSQCHCLPTTLPSSFTLSLITLINL